MSTHLIPSVAPRIAPFIEALDSISTLSTSGSSNEHFWQPKSEIAARAAGDLVSLKMRFQAGELIEKLNTNQLWNCLNRYVRVDSRANSTADRNGFTLICTHATGMHKETFEPLLRHLVDQAEKDSGYDVLEIWAFEAVQHGDSALVNAGKLGLLFDWTDSVRDVINFLLYYLPDVITFDALPIHLEHVSSDIANVRLHSGYPHRRLFGVGHSFGGTILTHIAYHIPALFAHSGIILLDPVVQPSEQYVLSNVWPYILSSLTRRSSWPSRAEAYLQLKASPFFGRWNDEVLRLFVDCGLYEVEDEGVRLKCDNVQEAIVFTDMVACAEAWMHIPHIDTHIALKWVVPPASRSVLKDPRTMEERVRRRSENSSHAVIESGGHMLVQDSPRESAHEIHLMLRELASGPRTRL